MKRSQLVFLEEFPRADFFGEDLLLIYDKILLKKSNSFLRWKKGFSKSYAVSAGEDLKDISNFPQHISKIVELCRDASARKLTLVVVGGGSVGDFGGFVASVLKRGVGLVHVPSTWLAALDSSHGGKTALNVADAKNQIGSFYPASKVLLIKTLLFSQPPARAFEGFGELLKISLLEGQSLWKNLRSETRVDSELLWKYLKKAIQAKLKVVAQDPEERAGIRHILNLGHTVGHVIEAHYQLPHGVAINYGLDFALRWSVQRKIMTQAELDRILQNPICGYLLSARRDALFSLSSDDLKKYRALLLSDKKKTAAAKVRFVFLKSPGQACIQEVSVDQILIEICRQHSEGRDV